MEAAYTKPQQLELEAAAQVFNLAQETTQDGERPPTGRKAAKAAFRARELKTDLLKPPRTGDRKPAHTHARGKL